MIRSNFPQTPHEKDGHSFLEERADSRNSIARGSIAQARPVVNVPRMQIQTVYRSELSSETLGPDVVAWRKSPGYKASVSISCFRSEATARNACFIPGNRWPAAFTTDKTDWNRSQLQIFPLISLSSHLFEGCPASTLLRARNFSRSL